MNDFERQRAHNFLKNRSDSTSFFIISITENGEVLYSIHGDEADAYISLSVVVERLNEQYGSNLFERVSFISDMIFDGFGLSPEEQKELEVIFEAYEGEGDDSE